MKIAGKPADTRIAGVDPADFEGGNERWKELQAEL